jgi:1,4-alpha-glucan branching enzyme
MVGVARRPATQVAQQPVPAPVSATSETPASLASSGAVQQVQFVLVAPSAKSVALVGDFNDWSAVPLAPVQVGGAWTITVPLAPGRYTYNFVVDGSRVMPDPAAPEAPADDFGTPASVVTVAGAQS